MTVDINIKGEMRVVFKILVLPIALFASDSQLLRSIQQITFSFPSIENSQPNICCAEALLLLCAFLAFKGANLDSGEETCVQCLDLHSFTSALCRI